MSNNVLSCFSVSEIDDYPKEFSRQVQDCTTYKNVSGQLHKHRKIFFKFGSTLEKGKKYRLLLKLRFKTDADSVNLYLREKAQISNLKLLHKIPNPSKGNETDFITLDIGFAPAIDRADCVFIAANCIHGQDSYVALDYIVVADIAPKIERELVLPPAMPALTLSNVTGTSKKVAILDKYWNTNNGGALTVLAAYETIRQIGYDPIMLRFPLEDPIASAEKNKTLKIVNHFYKYSDESLGVPDCKMYNDNVGAFVVPSDVVFSHNGSFEKYAFDYDYYLFLHWVNDEKNKIAWSSSFGTSVDQNWQGEQLDRIVGYLSRFDSLSIREKPDADRLQELGLNARQICDPVITQSNEFYKGLSNVHPHEKQKKYCFVYYFSGYKEIAPLLKKICDQLGLAPLIWSFNKDRATLEEHFDSAEILTPEKGADFTDWLWYLMNADYVLTHSFHALLFSLMFNVPVIATKRHGIKVKYCAEHYGLAERYIDANISETPVELIEKPIDWDSVNSILKKDKQESIDYITKALQRG